MRVHLAHDWYSRFGGSESVARDLRDLVRPDSLSALWVEPRARVHGVTETWMRRYRFANRKALLLPVMPDTWARVPIDDADVLVTSSHAFAHHAGLLAPRQPVRISYIHSPARYVWSPGLDPRASAALLRPARAALSFRDRKAVERIDHLVANSAEVASRIAEFWGRDDVSVVHPAVDIDYFAMPAGRATMVLPEDFLLAVSRWIPYKRLDLAIRAAALARRPLVVAGDGPGGAELRVLARECGADVRFVAGPSRAQLRELYQRASVLLFPAHEDFGMVPVEAQAAGLPVVALARGGSLETVAPGRTGILVDEADPEAFAAALPAAQQLGDPAVLRHWVQQFSRSAFRADFSRVFTGATGQVPAGFSRADGARPPEVPVEVA